MVIWIDGIMGYFVDNILEAVAGHFIDKNQMK